MLVLSRKLGQRIVVPECELTVSIVAIEGNGVRVGISAPDDVAVYREEVWQRCPRAPLASNRQTRLRKGKYPSSTTPPAMNR